MGSVRHLARHCHAPRAATAARLPTVRILQATNGIRLLARSEKERMADLMHQSAFSSMTVQQGCRRVPIKLGNYTMIIASPPLPSSLRRTTSPRHSDVSRPRRRHAAAAAVAWKSPTKSLTPFRVHGAVLFQRRTIALRECLLEVSSKASAESAHGSEDRREASAADAAPNRIVSLRRTIRSSNPRCVCYRRPEPPREWLFTKRYFICPPSPHLRNTYSRASKAIYATSGSRKMCLQCSMCTRPVLAQS